MTNGKDGNLTKRKTVVQIGEPKVQNGKPKVQVGKPKNTEGKTRK